MGRFDVVVQTAGGLLAEDEVSDFVSHYVGVLRYHQKGTAAPARVGRFVAYRLHAGQALDAAADLSRICDAHSQDLHDLYQALYDPATDDFRSDVRGQFDALAGDLLVLDQLVLHPRWRGLRLGLVAARRAIDLLAGGCALVAWNIQPLAADGDKAVGLPASWLPRLDGPAAVRQARVKLRRYFRTMGFRRIRRTPFYGLSLARRLPSRAEILRAGSGTAADPKDRGTPAR